MLTPNRAIAVVPVGGASLKPGSRGDSFVAAAGGWKPFVEQRLEPLADLGWIPDLHNPHGRTILTGGNFERPMPFGAKLDILWKRDRGPGHHYLLEDFEDAIAGFVERRRDPSKPWAPLILYNGCLGDDFYAEQCIRDGLAGKWLWYCAQALNDFLNSGADLWFDAAFAIYRAGEVMPLAAGNPTHAIIEACRAAGVYCGIESHPFPEQWYAHGYPVWTSWIHWQRAWKKFATRAMLTGEIIMSTDLYPGNFRGDIDAWVAAQRQLIETHFEPTWSIAIPRFDLILRHKLTPADFGFRQREAA